MCYHNGMNDAGVKLGPNALLSFAVEMIAIGIYAWAPFAFLDQPLFVEILLAVVVVGLFAAVWARFAAPRSSTRLKGIALLLFKAAVFAPALLLLLSRYGWTIFIVGAAIALLNVLWEYLENREG